jgi:hypothetical protein
MTNEIWVQLHTATLVYEGTGNLEWVAVPEVQVDTYKALIRDIGLRLVCVVRSKK